MPDSRVFRVSVNCRACNSTPHARVCARTRAHTHATEHACAQGYTDSNGQYFDGGMDGLPRSLRDAGILPAARRYTSDDGDILTKSLDYKTRQKNGNISSKHALCEIVNS